MGCASSIHISDRVVYHSGKESEDSHSPQQTNTTQHQGNPASGLLLKPPSSKVRRPPSSTDRNPHNRSGECVCECACERERERIVLTCAEVVWEKDFEVCLNARQSIGTYLERNRQARRLFRSYRTLKQALHRG